MEHVQQVGIRALPSGYHIIFSGSSQTFQELFDGLIFTLIFGIFVAYIVLAIQFNSFIDPMTVLVSRLFSVTGAFAPLYLAGPSLNIYSMN